MSAQEQDTAKATGMSRFVDVRRGEGAALLLAFLYFFFLLASYYVLRPIREQVGSGHDSTGLRNLFFGTLVGMIVANPIYGWLVSRWPRRVFIPWVYRFFALNLLAFFLLWWFHPEEKGGPISNVFFVWLSIYNVFVVSVFWSFLADVFGLEASKRLFGCIAAGGSLGAVAGGAITHQLVEILGTTKLLLVSLVLLEIATQCMLGIVRVRKMPDEKPSHVRESPGVAPEQAQSGGIWNGFVLVVRSPYLLLIALHFLVASGIGTVLYFEQSQLVRAASPDAAERTRIFATIDVWTNAATLATQALLTAQIVRRLGIGFALILQPVAAVLALVGMAISPTLGVLIAAQMTLRTLQHATTRPAREMLFTVLGREVKYKAKSFVDTFIYRLGDQLGSWGFDALKVAGLSLGAIAWVTVPLTLAWCGIAAGLGRMQKRFAREPAAPLPASESAR